MWLLSSRLRRWVIFTLAAPTLTFLLSQVRSQLETRAGISTTTRTLGRAEQLLNRVSRRKTRQ